MKKNNPIRSLKMSPIIKSVDVINRWDADIDVEGEPMLPGKYWTHIENGKIYLNKKYFFEASKSALESNSKTLPIAIVSNKGKVEHQVPLAFFDLNDVMEKGLFSIQEKPVFDEPFEGPENKLSKEEEEMIEDLERHGHDRVDALKITSNLKDAQKKALADKAFPSDEQSEKTRGIAVTFDMKHSQEEAEALLKLIESLPKYVVKDGNIYKILPFCNVKTKKPKPTPEEESGLDRIQKRFLEWAKSGETKATDNPFDFLSKKPLFSITSNSTSKEADDPFVSDLELKLKKHLEKVFGLTSPFKSFNEHLWKTRLKDAWTKERGKVFSDEQYKESLKKAFSEWGKSRKVKAADNPFDFLSKKEFKFAKSGEPAGKEPQNQAERHNQGKPQWHLVDFKALEPMVKVLEFGAKKYSPNNWKKGLTTTSIIDSLMRHLAAYQNGQDNDPETNLPHPAHMLCNLMMLMHFHNHEKWDDRNKTNP